VLSTRRCPALLRAVSFAIARLARTPDCYSLLGQVGRNRSPNALRLRYAVLGLQRLQAGEQFLRYEYGDPTHIDINVCLSIASVKTKTMRTCRGECRAWCVPLGIVPGVKPAVGTCTDPGKIFEVDA
jgi:hypothetical protein